MNMIFILPYKMFSDMFTKIFKILQTKILTKFPFPLVFIKIKLQISNFLFMDKTALYFFVPAASAATQGRSHLGGNRGIPPLWWRKKLKNCF